MITLLIGPPGAGKGTQADLLVEKCGFRKLSTGDILRKHIRDKTEIGLVAAKIVASGMLVSDEILLELLKQELGQCRSDKVLLDGYPRNLSQAATLDSIEFATVDRVIHIDVNREELIARLSGRRTCLGCGASYHLTSNRPKQDGTCDKCGGELVQRPDDVEDKVVYRLEVYDSMTLPVLEYYRSRGLYHRVDGCGKTSSVFSRLEAELQS